MSRNALILAAAAVLLVAAQPVQDVPAAPACLGIELRTHAIPGVPDCPLPYLYRSWSDGLVEWAVLRQDGTWSAFVTIDKVPGTRLRR